MKFTVTFKTPDAVNYAIEDEDMSEEEQEESLAFSEKYVQYGEIVSIEFDTELGTATVLKAR